VSLHDRVNLQQKAGEDWNDSRLILSTSATDILDAGVPASESLATEPKAKPRLPPLPPIGSGRHCTVKVMGFEPDFALRSSYIAPTPQQARTITPPIISVQLMETTAIVSKNPMAVSYTIDEPTTIPSDHLSHNVLVAIIPFEATISHITNPRKSPIAYLQVGIHLPVQLEIEL